MTAETLLQLNPNIIQRDDRKRALTLYVRIL